MERPDPYGEWVLHPKNETRDARTNAPFLAAARAAWPRVLAHAKLELRNKNSDAETEALAGEVWESVLKSVAKALQRKRDSEPIADVEGYLFAAFHHRFNRLLKAEQKRNDVVELVASAADFDRITDAQRSLCNAL